MVADIVWNVKPQIADLGFLELRWYSLMFLLGFVVSYYVMSKVFKKEGLSIEVLDKLTFYIVIATILGARIGHCLFYEPQNYLSQPWLIILPFEGKIGVDFRFTGYQGLASHGGIAGILIALWLFTRKFKLSYIWLVDRLAIIGALAGFFIRVGNFFNSEIVGTATDMAWGVKFVRLAPPGIPIDQISALHPAQLYEAFCYLIIFIIIITIYYKKQADLKPGLLIGLMFFLIFIARFLVEFVKKDQVGFEANMALNMGQILSIPFILAGLYLILRKPKTPQINNA